MELKFWIFCRYGSPTAINHPKTSLNIDKSTFKCTHCNKIGPTSLDIPQFQSNDSWIPRKPRLQLLPEIKTEANVAEKASALVAATDHGDRFHPLDLPHKKLFPQPMDIQTRQTIGCGIKRGKLYYLDLQSKDSNKLQQALMADGSEREKKKSEIWLWHSTFGTCFLWGSTIRKFRLSIMIIISLRKMNLDNLNYVNQEVGELDMSGQQFGSEDVFTEIPNQSSSIEGVLNLEPDPFIETVTTSS
ncbi:hypothetical protein CK203_100304 [Vitis vinifera]|uniref:Uncharacterized protein n=1 Tax=Vitis vinifera TaxID=29760 RepID=A0A438D394_VITVI|nr:hypothetical protein CK203_100304 [Vitis vinifera]